MLIRKNKPEHVLRLRGKSFEPKVSLILGIFALYLNFSAAAETNPPAEAYTTLLVSCKDFEGRDFIRKSEEIIITGDDSYSGQEILFVISGDAQSKSSAIWRGQNTRSDVLTLAHVFRAGGVTIFTFTSAFPDVHRTYSIFIDHEKLRHTASFTEAQTQFMTGLQQARTFMSTCSVLGV
jgi:hypothetical protein